MVEFVAQVALKVALAHGLEPNAFQGRHQIIDQNWDLKGFKETLMRIIGKLGLSNHQGTGDFEKYLEKMINS